MGDAPTDSVNAGTAAREAAQTAMLGRVGALARDIDAMRKQCAQFFAATRASRQSLSAASSNSVPTTATASSGRQHDHISSSGNENESDDDIDALFDEPASVDDEVIGAPQHKRAKQEANTPPPAASKSAAVVFDPFAVSDEEESGQSQGSDDDILDCTGAISPSTTASSSSASASSISAANGTTAEASRARPIAAPLPPGWSRLTPQQRVEQTMQRLSRDMKRKR